MSKNRYDLVVEPKAGKVGVLAVFFFGVFSILVVFMAAYMWTDADIKLAGAIGVASILIPTSIGYLISEVRHQRAGAFWFLMVAAIMAGSLGAWAIGEREAFQDRMDLIAPGIKTPSSSGA